MMTIESTINHFPYTRGIDTIRLYICNRDGNITVREFDVDQRESLWWNFRNANFSYEFLDKFSDVRDFEFLIESESIVLEIQVNNLKNF
jgi:hypothetical protein